MDRSIERMDVDNRSRAKIPKPRSLASVRGPRPTQTEDDANPPTLPQNVALMPNDDEQSDEYPKIVISASS